MSATADYPYTIYDYRDSRSRDGPAQILKNFRGYLQTDAYASYESVVLESAGRIIPVGCWAHARREFFDARLNQGYESHYVLSLVGQLYDIEDEVRLQSPEARLAARQERSVPILDRLEKFLREQKGSALPKSQYGKAVGYALNHWPELRRFTENGLLEIDNNIAERTMRPCAIGRNYAEFQIMRSCGSLTSPSPGKPAIRLRIIPYKPPRNFSSSGPGWNVPFCAGSSSKLSSARCFIAMSASTY